MLSDRLLPAAVDPVDFAGGEITEDIGGADAAQMVEVFGLAAALEGEASLAQRVLEFPSVGDGHQGGGVPSQAAGQHDLARVVIDPRPAQLGPSTGRDEPFHLVDGGEIGGMIRPAPPQTASQEQIEVFHPVRRIHESAKQKGSGL